MTLRHDHQHLLRARVMCAGALIVTLASGCAQSPGRATAPVVSGFVEAHDATTSLTLKEQAEPSTVEPVVDLHAIVEVDDRLYVLVDGQVPTEGMTWRAGAAAVGADIDVALAGPSPSRETFTLVADSEGPCVASATRRAYLRAHVYNSSDHAVQTTAPRAALELDGCPAELFGTIEMAFAIRGAHPGARLSTPRPMGRDRLRDIAVLLRRTHVTSRFPQTPDELVVEDGATFRSLPFEWVVLSVRSHDDDGEELTVLLRDGELVSGPDLGFNLPLELNVARETLLVWTLPPVTIRFGRLEGSTLAIERDLSVLIPLDYYLIEGC